MWGSLVVVFLFCAAFWTPGFIHWMRTRGKDSCSASERCLDRRMFIFATVFAVLVWIGLSCAVIFLS